MKVPQNEEMLHSLCWRSSKLSRREDPQERRKKILEFLMIFVFISHTYLLHSTLYHHIYNLAQIMRYILRVFAQNTFTGGGYDQNPLGPVSLH